MCIEPRTWSYKFHQSSLKPIHWNHWEMAEICRNCLIWSTMKRSKLWTNWDLTRFERMTSVLEWKRETWWSILSHESQWISFGWDAGWARFLSGSTSREACSTSGSPSWQLWMKPRCHRSGFRPRVLQKFYVSLFDRTPPTANGRSPCSLVYHIPCFSHSIVNYAVGHFTACPQHLTAQAWVHDVQRCWVMVPSRRARARLG